MSWRLLLLPAALLTARHATAQASASHQSLPSAHPPLSVTVPSDPASNPCASSYYYHPPPPPPASYSWTNSDSPLARLLRSAILTLVHGLCALHLRLNTVHAHNLPGLHSAILHRPPSTALLTLSNHTSTLDDPYIVTALLPPSSSHAQGRYGWCAEDVCFKRGWYAPFFRLGRVFPIRRRYGDGPAGGGLYQEGMSEALSYMAEGGWMHVSLTHSCT